MKILHFCLKKPLVINLITVMILALGFLAARSLNREAFPSVNFDYVAISTPYPGASPKEIELYIINPIEAEVAAVDGVIELKSTSIEGSGTIVAKLDTDIPDEQNAKVVDDIIRAVQRVKDLPADLPTQPVVTEIKSDKWPIIQLALYSDDKTLIELDKYAKDIIRKIETISDVASVQYMGKRLQEYWVEVDQDKASKLQISLGSIIAALKVRNISLPGGTLQSESGEYLVRTVATVDHESDISEIILRSNDSGRVVRLGDIASVRKTLEDPRYTYKANSKSAILLQVLKASSGDAIRLVDEVKNVTNKYLQHPDNADIKVSYVNDFSLFVRNRLGVLVNNGIYGIVFVALILIFILSPGIAFVTSLGMPLAFIGAILFMSYVGMTINLLSMFGMIIVLGILVDDAIIVGENIWYYYERGMSPFDATIKGTTDVIVPVAATIVTTIAAFSPLMMMSGVMGEFISEMPKVVIAALAASWLEAMFILPLHAYDVMRFTEWRKKRKSQKHGKPAVASKLDEKKKTSYVARSVSEIYSKILYLCLKFRYSFVILLLLFSVFTGWFVQNSMKLILFPPDGIEQFFVRAELPVGTPIDETMEEMKKLEAVVRQMPENELMDYVTTVGIQQNDANDPFTARGKHLGEVKVYLTAEKDRDRDANLILEEVRKNASGLIGKSKILKLRYDRVKNGPPQGKAIAVRISAADFEVADLVSQKLQDKLSSYDGVFDLDTTYKKNRQELLVTIDEAKAAKSLLTMENIATHVRAALDGAIASYVRTSEERQAIRVKHSSSGLSGIKTLEGILIPNQYGNLIRLGAVASFTEELGLTAIAHHDRRRTITLSADVDIKKTTSSEVNSQLIPYIDKLMEQHPDVTISQGGEFEDTNKSMESLQRAFIVASFAIFFILATIFGNLTQPFVVMMAIPFAIVGVAWSLYFHGLPLSFLSMIGTIGLAGVVVNDSIVLVDYMNKLVKDGQSYFDAAYNSAMRRFRPVWLTTLTTVAGLVPMVYGLGGFDKFLQPAAVSLGYGLLFGTILILLFIPALCIIRTDILAFFRRLFHSVS